MDKARKKALKEKKRKQAKRKEQQKTVKTLSAPDYLKQSVDLLRQHKEPQAETLLKKAMLQHPNQPELYGNMVHALYLQGRGDEAIAMAQECVDRFPEFAEGHNNLGVVQKFEGKLEEARGSYRKALDFNPKDGEHWRNYSAVKKFAESDTEELEAMQALANQRKHQSGAKPSIFFAYAKALEDLKQYEEAWTWYRKGNQVMRSRSQYKREEFEEFVDAVIAMQQAEFFAKPAPKSPCSERPILIVGMPRSGSTLVEQVLASHPQVEGTGEESDLGYALASLGSTAIKRVQSITEQTTDQMARIARSYCDRQRARIDAPDRIADKFLQNFVHLGFVFHAMPGARIIHTRRNPLDNIFSCFKILFTSNLPYTYDLEDIASYYEQVERLMNHWNQFMSDRILALDYEEMVADQEGQTRRLLEFLDLPWDPACLEFFKKKRKVTSASATQVRQPIYNSSVAYWRNFEKQLDPLKARFGVE